VNQAAAAQHESADVAVKSQTVMHVVIYGINIDRVSNSSSDGWHFLNPAQTLDKSYVNCPSKTDVLLSFFPLFFCFLFFFEKKKRD
jgi:hypothetical protein